MGPLFILVGVFVLIWALVILPQQRQVKHHKAVVARLQVGDEVMTTAGLYGTIADLVVEVAPGTVLRIARGAVGRRLIEEQAAVDEAPAVPAGTAADRAAALDAPTDAPTDAPDPEPAPDAAPAEP